MSEPLPLNQVLLGDCFDRLKELPDESLDACVVDPPYGLGTKEPTGDEIIAYLQGATLDTGGDFMNRRWSIPSVAVWSEVLRILKPGAHALVFGGPRTFDLISIGLRAAGFECRDTIASIFGTQVFAWVTGSGFPKGQDVHATMLKAGIAPTEVEEWRGWNCQLKPSFEPISIFRKPLRESTIARQVLSTGTGALNIDACRVKVSPDDPNHRPGITNTTDKQTMAS